MDSVPSPEDVIETARLAGCLLLENGGETYRAEETMQRICISGGYPESEVIALTTGIFLSLGKDGVSSRAQIKRIKKRSVDLTMLDTVNTVSRQITAGKLSFSDALDKLRSLSYRKHRRFHLLRYCMWSALACALFTLVYGGNLFDAVVSLICGAGEQLISSSFSRIRIYPFATSLIGSAFIAALSVAATSVFRMGSVDMIIIGAIIPMLPGIAMTNAIRDAIMGDLISGSSRLIEALLTSIGIASGCGIVFSIYVSLGGAL